MSMHGMRPAGAMSASLDLGMGMTTEFICSSKNYSCVHPQMSGTICCLPSKPMVEEQAVSQVHMVASFHLS